jgi:hypothetical protein
MERKIAWVRVRVAALLATAVLTGCSGADSAQRLVAPTAPGEVLRTRSDTARGRVWVLSAEDLRVYDAATKKLVRRISLPGWSAARYECRPDIALDGSGSAIISSNVVPHLWRVDARTFKVTEQAVALEGRAGWDIGFGPIALARSGTVYALTSNGMSLWKVEPGSARAALAETYLPPVKDCALPERVIERLERSGS